MQFEDPTVTQARPANDAAWNSKLESRLTARKQARQSGETQVSAHRRTLGLRYGND